MLFRSLVVDVRGVNGAVVAAVDAEEDLELLQVRLDGGQHVGVLQLAGKIAAVAADGAVHLAERGGCRGFVPEALEALLPRSEARRGGHGGVSTGGSGWLRSQ